MVKIEQSKIMATVKSLKWICNQIPNDLGDSNEERMLKCIRLYCERGISVIELLYSVNQQLLKSVESLEKSYKTDKNQRGRE